MLTEDGSVTATVRVGGETEDEATASANEAGAEEGSITVGTTDGDDTGVKDDALQNAASGLAPAASLLLAACVAAVVAAVEM